MGTMCCSEGFENATYEAPQRIMTNLDSTKWFGKEPINHEEWFISPQGSVL